MIASVEPIERSIPFVVITKVIAHAAIKTGALCLNKFSMFLFEKKASAVIEKKVTIIIGIKKFGMNMVNHNMVT